MNDRPMPAADSAPAPPKKSAYKISLAAAVAAVLVLVGVLVGTKLGHDKPAPKYWETTSGQLEMRRQAVEQITATVVRKGYSPLDHSEPKYKDLSVIMSFNLAKDGKQADMWFKVEFAAGDNSVTAIGDPKIALTEGEL